jgi:hypothetical protein
MPCKQPKYLIFETFTFLYCTLSVTTKSYRGSEIIYNFGILLFEVFVDYVNEFLVFIETFTNITNW